MKNHSSNTILMTSPLFAEWFKTLEIRILEAFGFLARLKVG